MYLTYAFWQVEYLLEAVTSGSSTQLAVAAVEPLSLCGNGVCEIGERPGGNSTSSFGTGACKHTLHPFVHAPQVCGKLCLVHRTHMATRLMLVKLGGNLLLTVIWSCQDVQQTVLCP